MIELHSSTTANPYRVDDAARRDQASSGRETRRYRISESAKDRWWALPKTAAQAVGYGADKGKWLLARVIVRPGPLASAPQDDTGADVE